MALTNDQQRPWGEGMSKQTHSMSVRLASNLTSSRFTFQLLGLHHIHIYVHTCISYMHTYSWDIFYQFKWISVVSNSLLLKFFLTKLTTYIKFDKDLICTRVYTRYRTSRRNEETNIKRKQTFL